MFIFPVIVFIAILSISYLIPTNSKKLKTIKYISLILLIFCIGSILYSFIFAPRHEDIGGIIILSLPIIIYISILLIIFHSPTKRNKKTTIIKYTALSLLFISEGIMLFFFAAMFSWNYVGLWGSSFSSPGGTLFIFLPILFNLAFLISTILFACINSTKESAKAMYIKSIAKSFLILGVIGCLLFLLMFAIVLGTGKWFQ